MVLRVALMDEIIPSAIRGMREVRSPLGAPASMHRRLREAKFRQRRGDFLNRSARRQVRRSCRFAIKGKLPTVEFKEFERGTGLVALALCAVARLLYRGPPPLKGEVPKAQGFVTRSQPYRRFPFKGGKGLTWGSVYRP